MEAKHEAAQQFSHRQQEMKMKRTCKDGNSSQKTPNSMEQFEPHETEKLEGSKSVQEGKTIQARV